MLKKLDILLWGCVLVVAAISFAELATYIRDKRTLRDLARASTVDFAGQKFKTLEINGHRFLVLEYTEAGGAKTCEGFILKPDGTREYASQRFDCPQAITK